MRFALQIEPDQHTDSIILITNKKLEAKIASIYHLINYFSHPLTGYV